MRRSAPAIWSSLLATAVLFLSTQCIAQLRMGVPGLYEDSAKEPPLAGFTCCNLHYEGDWISDVNWSSMAMIPAGSRIRTTAYFTSQNRIAVNIDGKAMRLGLDYGRRQQSLADWARKLIVAEDPGPRIASWPPAVRDAIGLGKVALGMTREQAIVALGYPAMHQTPSLDAAQWKYWHTGFGAFLVVWDEAGRVKEVVADAVVRHGVLHEPKN